MAVAKLLIATLPISIAPLEKKKKKLILNNEGNYQGVQPKVIF